MQIEHPDVELLSGFVDGVLDELERGELGGHLDSCASCRQEVERLRQTAVLLRALPAVPPPRDFRISALRSERASLSFLDRWARPAPLRALAGVAAALALVILVVDVQPPRQLALAPSAARLEAPAAEKSSSNQESRPRPSAASAPSAPGDVGRASFRAEPDEREIHTDTALREAPSAAGGAGRALGGVAPARQDAIQQAPAAPPFASEPVGAPGVVAQPGHDEEARPPRGPQAAGGAVAQERDDLLPAARALQDAPPFPQRPPTDGPSGLRVTAIALAVLGASLLVVSFLRARRPVF